MVSTHFQTKILMAFHCFRALEISLKQVESHTSTMVLIMARWSLLLILLMEIEFRSMELTSQESFFHSRDWTSPNSESQFWEELELELWRRLLRSSTSQPNGKPLPMLESLEDTALEQPPLILIDSRSWSKESKEAMLLESSPSKQESEKCENCIRVVVIQSDKNWANLIDHRENKRSSVFQKFFPNSVNVRISSTNVPNLTLVHLNTQNTILPFLFCLSFSLFLILFVTLFLFNYWINSLRDSK